MDVAIATVTAKNYLSFARVLAESLRRFHPEVPLFALLSDEVDGHFDPGAEPFELLRLTDVGIPNLARFRFNYDLKQVAVASKPYLLNSLLDRGFASVLFFDPDILILNDLEPLLSTVREHAIVLLPHLLEPLPGPGAVGRELNIIQSGVFNAGCLGVSEKPGGRQFLRWWQKRLYEHCQNAVPEGLYYDQRWLDLAPVFFEDVYILRDPSFNVAHWNLPERRVAVDNDLVWVNDRPCRFFHFSGFAPDEPDRVTRYSARLAMADLGHAMELFRRYAALLDAAGYHQTKNWPYAYDRFDNGVPITETARRLYRELGEQANRFGDPLKTTQHENFYRWLKQQHGVVGKMRRLWWTVHKRWPNLARVWSG